MPRPYRLVERNGNLFVREVLGIAHAYYWPLTYSCAEFARRYGAERLARLLAEGIVYDGASTSSFVTPDGILLPLPDGGQTKPAWIEDLENVQQPSAQPVSRRRKRSRR
jgi:hypothetical protein